VCSSDLSTWEEINRVPNPTAGLRNFGWPCYEGTGRMGGYDALDVNLCESLYDQGTAAHAAPYYTYNHTARVVSGDACRSGSSSISGLAFTPPQSSFPSEYDGALFFSDYSRDCIWAMLRGSDGLPDPGRIRPFFPNASNPAELQFGPGGDLYYVDLEGGNIRRVRSLTTNRAPVARATANPTGGPVPLTVDFDGSTSSDPDGSALTYSWDLNGDGAFGDATGDDPSYTYTVAGTYTARLRVRDPGGLEDTVNVPITAGSPPVPVIDITSPAPGTTWKVDDAIAFSGSAKDFLGTPIPASGLTWNVVLHHCHTSGGCHTHPIQSFSGVTGGSFPAPDHEYPSHLEISLTARDSGGLSATVTQELHPRTVELTLASEPAGMQLALGSEPPRAAPFTRQVIQGSTNSIGAVTPQHLGDVTYDFAAWSNAGARNHTTEVDADTTLTASFERSTARLMGGTTQVGPGSSVAPPGTAEVYRTVATEPGRVTEIGLYVRAESTTSDLVLGLYADDDGRPATLLGSGRIEDPQEGSWNRVSVDIPGVEAGEHYWIGLLNPSDASGMLRWHDSGAGAGGPEQQHTDRSLPALPSAWESGHAYDAGPASAYISGPPPPPPLAVSPASLSFSARAGAASPATSTLRVTSGPSFSVSDDAGWLAVTPASGTAPRDLTVAVDTAGLAAGTHTATIRVVAAGEAPKLVPVTLTLSAAPSSPPPGPPPPGPDPEPPTPPEPGPAGPVGAWGFDEPRGRRALDASGAGNHGRLSGPARTRGRFGGALEFDGRGDWVTIPDADALDLRTAMTLEAWVRPSARGAMWRTIAVKERGRRLAYGLYAGPSGHVFTTREHALRGRRLPLRRWSHLAMTWDGLIARLYVDGREVARHALVGPAEASSGPLRIGGNAIWPEWFRGRIDELRIYDRALTEAEIAADRRTAIDPGATAPKAREDARRRRARRTKLRAHRGSRWVTARGADR
jgi:PKD repeat protein